jgi:hypothetical protein
MLDFRFYQKPKVNQKAPQRMLSDSAICLDGILLTACHMFAKCQKIIFLREK